MASWRVSPRREGVTGAAAAVHCSHRSYCSHRSHCSHRFSPFLTVSHPSPTTPPFLVLLGSFFLLSSGLALVGHELKVYGDDSLYKGGAEIEPEELLQIASDIEGHPDNVCPCIYGGIQLGILLEAQPSIGQKRHWRSCRVNCPTEMQLVAFISDTVGKTSELRAVLPETLTYPQAVFNIGRTAFLVNALNQNKLYDLKFGTQDALHQPQRGAKVYHHLQPLIDAGLAEGAHAVYLSGELCFDVGMMVVPYFSYVPYVPYVPYFPSFDQYFESVTTSSVVGSRFVGRPFTTSIN